MPKKIETPKVTRKSPKGERTRAKILDVAERLFAQRPYEAVSQRQVADEAELLIGLITHHYPNKVSLFDAVVGRRASELNRLRMQQLGQLENPTADQVIDAFFMPLIERISSGGEGWQNYSHLMSKLVYSDIGIEVSNKYYADAVRSFLEALKNALPEIDDFTVAHAFLYSIDVVLTSLYFSNRFERIMGPETFKDRDVKDAYSTIRPFLLGGIAALQAQTRSAQTPRSRTRKANR